MHGFAHCAVEHFLFYQVQMLTYVAHGGCNKSSLRLKALSDLPRVCAPALVAYLRVVLIIIYHTSDKCTRLLNALLSTLIELDADLEQIKLEIVDVPVLNLMPRVYTDVND